MSNICLKVTIETQNFNFLGIKIFYQFRFGELQLSQISLNFKTCCNLKIKRLGAKLWLFYYFNFERSNDILKSKSPCTLLNKNINLKRNRIENGKAHTPFQRDEPCASVIFCKLKLKLWWIEARGRKKRAFFVPFIWSEGYFFKICVLFQCNMYSVLNTLSEYT